MLIVIAHGAVRRVSRRLLREASLSDGGPRPLGPNGLQREYDERRHSYRIDQKQKSYDVSADLVIMAGWLHPIPFRTRP